MLPDLVQSCAETNGREIHGKMYSFIINVNEFDIYRFIVKKNSFRKIARGKNMLQLWRWMCQYLRY